MASDPKPGEILIFKPKLVEKLQIKVDKTIRKNVKDYKKWVVKHKNRSKQEDFIPKEIDLKQAENSCYTSIDRYTKELVSGHYSSLYRTYHAQISAASKVKPRVMDDDQLEAILG